MTAERGWYGQWRDWSWRRLGWPGGGRRRSSSALTVSVAAASVVGRRRENQDNYLILQQQEARYLKDGQVRSTERGDWPAGRARIALFDGMGGHAHGREAAEAAVQGAIAMPPCSGERALREAVLALHQQLLAELGSVAGEDQGASHASAAPGTTVVWLELDLARGRGWLANVGDSRVYANNGRRWNQLTYDHSLAEFNWRDGDIGDRDYQSLRHSPGQSLAQALGYGSWGICRDDRGIKPFRQQSGLRLDLAAELMPDKAAHADVIGLELDAGQRLLLASDGLWDGYGDARWPGPPARWAREAGDWVRGGADGVRDRRLADQLAVAAIAAGGSDNVTVLLCGLD